MTMVVKERLELEVETGYIVTADPDWDPERCGLLPVGERRGEIVYIPHGGYTRDSVEEALERDHRVRHYREVDVVVVPPQYDDVIRVIHHGEDVTPTWGDHRCYLLW